MSENPDRGATTVRASKGNSAGKWLLGAVAAVIVAGGGYLAWTTMAPGQSQTQIAANDVDGDPLRAGPLPPSEANMQSAAADESRAEPAAETQRSATPRRTLARADAVPEETIGASDTDPDAIIVRAPQRAVWTRMPNQRQLERLYPARALEWGREGEARLHCTVQEGGALDCVKVEETSGGFGNAALRVARTLRHAPQRADGSDATGAPVNLRVVFRLADEDRRFGRG